MKEKKKEKSWLHLREHQNKIVVGEDLINFKTSDEWRGSEGIKSEY